MDTESKNDKTSAEILVKELGSLIDRQKDLIGKAGEKAVLNCFAPIFAKCPEIKSISWNQYTPYFMDGDPCIFSANTDTLNFDCSEEYFEKEVRRGDERIHAEYYEGEGLTVYTFNDELTKIFPSLGSFSKLPQEVFYQIWGDHTTVRITCVDGHLAAAAEDYEHD